jgi:hypothetical protein
MSTVLAIVAMVCLLPATANAQAPVPEKALESITVDELVGLLKYYSSDWFEGRASGTPGYDMATDFLAATLAASGVAPAGPEGSYFQMIDLTRYGLSEDMGFEVRRGESAMGPYVAAVDFEPGSGYADWKVSGEPVFAGFGINAPDMGWNDYVDLDVEGKVAVVVDGFPGYGTDETPLGDYRTVSRALRFTSKVQMAMDAGATGIIRVPHPRVPEMTQIRAMERITQMSRRLQLLEQVSETTFPQVTVSAKVAEDLFGAGALEGVVGEMEQQAQPRQLRMTGVTVSAYATMNREIVPTQNVVAMIEGTDLKDEYVVLGAHADHMGRRGDEIYNGADDDGSGSVLLLELAEAFATSGVQPRRTVIFGWWAGEELGLFGAWHYTHHPVGTIEKTVGLIQMDMVGRNEEYDPRKSRGLPEETAEQNTNAVNCIGYSYSSDMQALITRANEPVGLEVKFRYDQGTQNLLRRSDHWRFLEQGVPVAFLFTGIHPDYHEPTDTWDKINYPKMARIGEMAFRAAWELANTDTPPKINPGMDPRGGGR